MTAARVVAHGAGERVLGAAFDGHRQLQQALLAHARGRASVTLGAPSVTVPVLSNTTVFTSWAVSSASADLIEDAVGRPRPVPTMMAVGVARPSAHGHEMTSTLMACDMAVSSVEPPSIHTANVTTAMTMTTGTNTPDILSAIFSMGAFVDVASSTSRMMPASVVSSPTRSARMVNHPVRFTVAPVTASPGRLSTGTLSPVITDSSTVPEPSSRVPSTGARPRPRAHRQHVARAHRLHRDALLAAVHKPRGLLRREAHELGDGVGGLALRARLEVLAQRDEREDHGRRLEVQVHGRQVRGVQVARAQRDADLVDGVDAVHRGRRRAERDERVHVRRAVEQRLEAHAEELEVDEHDGQQQQELRERERRHVLVPQEEPGQRPAEHVSHRQVEQGDREHGRHDEAHANMLGLGGRVGHGARLGHTAPRALPQPPLAPAGTRAAAP